MIIAILVFPLLLHSATGVCDPTSPTLCKSICPAAHYIGPSCICKDIGDGPMMACNNLMSAEELMNPVKATENHDMFSLAIHDSSLLYIPNKIFQGTHFKKIRLFGTQLMSLAETDLAFEGLEDSLEEFHVMEARYAAEWSWGQLRDLHKLRLIDVDWVSLGSIGEPFPHLKSLTALGISRADISFIVDEAFKDLESLRILTLKDNDIAELKRSMFPNPAEDLFYLDLSGNKLDSLPTDIFDNMPALNDVNLSNNKFVTLHGEVFEPLMSRVLTLTLTGNDLRCDCRMRWIVGIRLPLELYAFCTQPELVKGMNIKYLGIQHLWC